MTERVPISEACDEHGVQPTLFYAWQKKLFEEGVMVFEQPWAKSTRQQAAEQRKIDALEAKVAEKNEVMAELMSEHVALKKSWGDLRAGWVAHDVRDEVVDIAPAYRLKSDRDGASVPPER